MQKRSRFAITAPIVFGVNSVGDENGPDVICHDMGIEVMDTLEKDSVKIL